MFTSVAKVISMVANKPMSSNRNNQIKLALKQSTFVFLTRRMLFVSLETSLIVIQLIIILVAMILQSIIWMYLSKKPLGMQTLVDFMIKDLIVLGYGALITSTEQVFGFGLPLNDEAALAIIYIQILVCNAWFIQNIALITTRFLSIFHVALMSSLHISDAKFVRIIRVGNCFLASWFLMYEVFTHDFRKGPTFKYLVGEEPDSNAKISSLFTVNFLLATNVLIMH